jgi:hypothetical protein
MALELVATAGADDANAYATVEEADAYAAYRFGGTAFTDLDADEKIQALVTAARDIDTLESDPGLIDDRYFTDQALAFPRGSADLPAGIITANIELAISYAAAVASGSADVLNADVGNANQKKVVVGPIEVEYFSAASSDASTLTRFPAFVQRLLVPFVVQPSTVTWGSAEVTRGS